MALRTIDQPNNFRSAINTSGADIAKNLIVKVDTANVDGCLLATAANQPVLGVTTEVIQAGTSRSVQVAGKTVLACGAAVAIGDGIVADATSRGIKGTAASAQNQVVGRAVTATATAGDLFEIELGKLGALT